MGEDKTRSHRSPGYELLMTIQWVSNPPMGVVAKNGHPPTQQPTKRMNESRRDETGRMTEGNNNETEHETRNVTDGNENDDGPTTTMTTTTTATATATTPKTTDSLNRHCIHMLRKTATSYCNEYGRLE